MSSIYNLDTSSAGVRTSREFDDDLGLNINYLPNTPFDSHHLSSYNQPQTTSNSASPSYNIGSTPGESLSDYSTREASEFSAEFEDEFFGVNFDAARVDSFTSNFADNIAYSSVDLNHTQLDLPEQTGNKRPSETFSFSTSIFPLSPINSAVSNPSSPRIPADDLKSKVTISQNELISGNYTSRNPPVNIPSQPHTTSIQLTPDQSGSSHTSGEGIEPSAMQRPEYSPNTTAPQWTSLPPGNATSFAHSSTKFNSSDINDFGSQLPTDTIHKPASGIERNEDGSWRSSTHTGQGGLNPDSRRAIENNEVPNLKEQEETRRVEIKNVEVEEWMSQNSGSSQGEDDPPSQADYFQIQTHHQQPAHDQRSIPEDQANNISPLDDAASVHENRLQEGQTYYDFTQVVISEADRNILSLPRHWNDAPSVPSITTSAFQPRTAAEAMHRFNENADAISLASRAATWGTRRRSEPSLADLEAVANGSFLKKLSISRSRDGDRPRPTNLFDQGLAGLANIVRKRSDSKLKRARSNQNSPEEPPFLPHGRHNSQDTLAPPRRSPGSGKRPTPSINTAFAAMAGPLTAVGTTHARNGSIGGQTSPRSPSHLGTIKEIISRHRSKSELGPNQRQGGLTTLWRAQGGPPVPNLATPPAQTELKTRESQQPKVQDNDDDDDDDDDEGDEEDSGAEQEVDPIVPNYEGFKAHVRRLNPDMDQQYNWLVSRIAHQQEIRYKNLLDLRVKHSQHLLAGNCQAGPHCMTLGGRATAMGAKGNPRDFAPTPGGLQLVTDFSDDSNPGEGALTDETFPQGVPMPPTRNLPAEFECQLCFKAKKFRKPSDWTKHVHEDVQPFTCTYEKCKESKSFKRKADWVRHENERHRHLEWWICQVEDCSHPCYRKDNFLQHLVREHKLPEPKQKTKAAIKKARLTEPAWIMLEKCHHETNHKPQEEPCKFCGKTFPTWKKLTVHLAKHMEHISLPVLRLVEAKTVDANTIISPVEQNLTPVTPEGRGKFDGGSPFNSDGLSPHPMASGQYQTNFNPPTYLQNPSPSNPFLHPQYPQDVNYNHNNIYSDAAFNVHPMDRSQRYMPVDANNLDSMVQNSGYGAMNSNFPQVKAEHSPAFSTMDVNFIQPMPNHNYNVHPSPEFSVSQPFSAASVVSGYPSTNLLVAGAATDFDFDPSSAGSGQTFQQEPMSRAPGSSSSYGHSPQNAPYYG